jgi:hypothetical protein
LIDRVGLLRYMFVRTPAIRCALSPIEPRHGSPLQCAAAPSLSWSRCADSRSADPMGGDTPRPTDQRGTASGYRVGPHCDRLSGGTMPVLDVGERLNTPSGRLDLAADLIGAMVHPKDKTGRRRRRSALSKTLLGMSDRDDEPEAHSLVKGWFRRAGGFKTASESDPYSKQQKDMLRLTRTRWHRRGSEQTEDDLKASKPKVIRHFLGCGATQRDGRKHISRPVPSTTRPPIQCNKINDL